jgi:hypothetical protein
VNPNDPTAVVADASDSESGVAGGSIEMAPAGSESWTAVPTTLAGGQLVGNFDDAGLHGLYTFIVRACDNVGNCDSATRSLMLPVRTQAISRVSLEQISTTGCATQPIQHAAAASTATSASQPPSDASDASEAGETALSGANLAGAGGALGQHHAAHVRSPIAAGSIFASATPWTHALSVARTQRHAQIARITTARQGRLRP